MLLMIDANGLQDRGIEFGGPDLAVYDLVTIFISLTENGSPLDAAAGE